MLGGQQEGTLSLLADLRATTSQLLKLYGSIFTLVLLASLLVAFILSGQFLRFLTDPILRLTETARTIDNHSDYSVRASKTCNDEVGVLTDAFNQMLDHIQSQDAELRGSQDKLAQAQRIAHLGHWERDLDTDRIRWSDETYRIFGLQPQEYVIDFGRVEKLIHPQDRELVKQTITSALNGGPRYDMEYRVIRPNGEVRFVHSQADIVKDNLGRPRQMFGTAQDVTEQKRAEQALREAEHKYRAIFENAIEGIFQSTPDGKWISVNPALARMYGYSTPEEFVGSVSDIVQLYVEPERRDELKHLLGMRAFVEGFEFECYRRDGSKMWLSENARAVCNANGEILYYEGAVQDVTERKRTEEARREAEQKYRAIFENAVEGIFQTTPDGHYLNVNPALARIYGYDSPEELISSVSDIGKTIYVDPKRRKEFKNLIEKNGAVELFEYEVFRKDGKRIWLCENARAVRDATGTIIYYEGCVEDITERKLVDEVKRASKAKSEFLSRMSHELRTPLNAILGFAQLLERQKPTEVQRKRIGYILNAGKHLLDLINEVLDISRIEAGKMQMSLEPVCVADALAEALDLMRPLATERTIHLSAAVNLDASVYVLADRQRFKQVLLNLLNNAVKYTPFHGAVSVSYSLYGQDKVRVLVSDTGPGIPAENLPRLFIPFERIGAEQSDVEGTGLGLALTKRLMQAMDGSIGVESTVGRGSTFWLELPRTKSSLEQLPAIPKSNGVRSSASEPATQSILYIEDNLSNLALVEQVLADRPGTALITSMEGKLGLDLARQHSPDLILLDLHLPDLPGWEVLAELKADAATRDIPVIVVSADATKRQINRLMSAGAAHYLTNPLDITKFFSVLDTTTAAPNGKKELAEVETIK
jgi:PAS domain S-box-containing protein